MCRKFEKSISFELFRAICIVFFIGLLLYFLYPIFKGILLSNDGSINGGNLTAIATILGLFYTLKIHRDNLEYQKRIELRKERMEFLRDIKNSITSIYDEVFKALDECLKNITNSIKEQSKL